jgi:hypothetical protein
LTSNNSGTTRPTGSRQPHHVTPVRTTIGTTRPVRAAPRPPCGVDPETGNCRPSDAHSTLLDTNIARGEGPMARRRSDTARSKSRSGAPASSAGTAEIGPRESGRSPEPREARDARIATVRHLRTAEVAQRWEMTKLVTAWDTWCLPPTARPGQRDGPHVSMTRPCAQSPPSCFTAARAPPAALADTFV